MDIRCDERLSAAPLPGRLWYPGWSLTVIVKAAFRLAPGPETQWLDPPSLTGDIPHDDAAPDAPPRYPSDLAWHKPAADLAIAGHARAPGGLPVRELEASVQLGAHRFALAVSGNREWQQSRGELVPGPAEPFALMPLRAERCYGGPGVDENPVGTGRGTHPKTGAPLPPPNIEHPARRLQRASQRLEPFGPSTIPITWPPRRDLGGTYGWKWQRDRSPWLPADLDWAFFNASPPHLRLLAYPAGDETLRLTNLIEGHQDLTTRLPGLRVRVLVIESAWAPPPPGVQEATIDLGEGLRLRELPARLDTVFIDTDAPSATLVWRASGAIIADEYEGIHRLWVHAEPMTRPPTPLADLAAIAPVPGREPAPEPPADPPPAPEASEAAEPTQEDAEAAKLAAKADADQQAAYDKALADGFNFEDPKATAATLAKLGLQAPDLEAAPPATSEANQPEPEPAPDATAPPRLTREDLLARYQHDPVIGAVNLDGVDLSGLELPGINLAGSTLRSARLDGADLSAAVLTAADLSDASMVALKAPQAVLDGADLSRVNARDADLTKASLFAAILAGASFDNASLDEAMAPGVNAAKARFRRARAAKSVWTGSDFTEADLAYARLVKADFAKCALRAARLFAAHLRGGSLRKADLRGANLAAADLFEAILEQADLSQADLTNANLYGAQLADVRLTDAKADGARVGGTVLSGKGV